MNKKMGKELLNFQLTKFIITRPLGFTKLTNLTNYFKSILFNQQCLSYEKKNFHKVSSFYFYRLIS